MKKIIDLSVAVESGLPCDPPNQIPHIKYCNHKDTAAEMAGFFGNATVDDLPEGNGWAIEFIKEVQKERKRTFAARWQQATNELRKHKDIISNIPIVPKEPPEISKEEKWN